MKRSRGTRAGRAPAQPLEQTATRRLCAGAYTDPGFRDMVIRKVHNNSSRRVAPCYGFDIIAVIQHAWRAYALEVIQQACIIAVIGFAAASDPKAALATACLVGIWWLAAKALPLIPELTALHARSAAAQALHRPVPHADALRLRELERMVALSAAGFVALALIVAMVAGAAAPGPPSSVVLTAARLVLVIMGVCAVIGVVRQLVLNRLYRAGSLQRPWRTRRLAAIEDQLECEYVVYRRSAPEHPDWKTDLGWVYQRVPFTGAGQLVHRWLPPLGIQLLRPGEGRMADREHAAVPFQAHELVEYLKMAMQPIGAAADPSRMRGFQVCDRLCIAEEDVTADREFLQGPRKAEEINQIIDDPHATAQHFLEIRVSRSGEVVTTAFLRVTVRGRALSLDFTTCALTRTPEPYGRLDEFGENGTWAVVRAGIRGIRDVPATAGQLWRVPLIPWMLAGAWRARKDRTLIPRRGKRIGTRISVREEAACDWADAGHDQVTIYDEMKIIEKRLLKATEDFLESRDVDTSMFKRLTFSIINTGFLNMGYLRANQGAFGQGAQFHNHTGEGQAGDAGEPGGQEGD